jgi:uncharacterized protein (TIGR03083 family)
MAGEDPWPMTHRERERVADLLAGIAPEQWDQPSLCAGWRVRDVAAHLIATAETTPGSFIGGFVSSGFKFHDFSRKNLARWSGLGPDEMVAAMRASAGRTTKPPGPPAVPLTEAVVHGHDIAQPLGLPLDTGPDALLASLDFYKGTQPLIGGKKRSAGLHWQATDVDWTYGSGPAVSGPAAAILLALSGRRDGLNGLEGDGVAELSSRM